MSRLHCIVIAAMLLCALNSQSQSDYNLDFNRELGLFSSGGLSLALALKLRSTTIRYDSFHLPPAININKLDQVAISNYSPSAKNTSNIVGYSSFLLPAIFLSSKKSRRDFGKIVLIWGEVITINAGLTGLSKHAFKRPRPFVYSTLEKTYPKSTISAQASFISGHTSVMASNMYFFAKTFSLYYPDSKLKPYIWGVSVVAPAFMGYLRVKAGVHYPTDVIAGYALGACVGMLVPTLHKNKKGRSDVTFFSVDNGLGMQFTF